MLIRAKLGQSGALIGDDQIYNVIELNSSKQTVFIKGLLLCLKFLFISSSTTQIGLNVINRSNIVYLRVILKKKCLTSKVSGIRCFQAEDTLFNLLLKITTLLLSTNNI